MRVIGTDGQTRDYAFAAIGDVLVPLVAGSKLERLFFRVTDVSSVPARTVRYERPPVEFLQDAQHGRRRLWGDDDSDDGYTYNGDTNKYAKTIKEWSIRRTDAIQQWFREYSKTHVTEDIGDLVAQQHVSFVPRI